MMGTHCLYEVAPGQQCGQQFGSDGMCPYGHQQPEALAEDTARTRGGDRDEPALCGCCGHDLQRGDHRACVASVAGDHVSGVPRGH